MLFNNQIFFCEFYFAFLFYSFLQISVSVETEIIYNLFPTRNEYFSNYYWKAQDF